MAPKTKKADKPAEEEPEAKKAKTEEKAEGAAEEKKEEPPKFQEPDAPSDNRPALKSPIVFEGADTTLNVVPTVGGKVLTNLTDGGMAFLLAGARANVAQKTGRYMFEVKAIQATDPSYGQAKGCRMMLRVGFSTSESSLLMDDSSAYFDCEGFYMGCKKMTRLGKQAQFYGKDKVVAVVLNLDSKSPNHNTVALYRDGVAMGDAMPLPEALHGKPLFPHIVYRNASMHVNFGPTALKELPFKCRMLGGAAASDVEVAASKAPKDGKCEVVLPVAFPDEGTFDWLDAFLEKNPKYTELSDRKIIQWCQASGLHSKGGGKNNSNDKPQVSFGIPPLDDFSVRRLVNTITPLVPRHYVVMEVTSNLMASNRAETLKRFSGFKKIAKVVMGEPNAQFKTMIQNKLLKDKQFKSDNAWRAKKLEKDKKRQQARMRKEAEARKKEVEKKRKEAAEAKKKAAEEAKKAEADKKEGEEEKKEEEKKEEEKKEEEKKEEEAPAEEKPAEEEKEEEEPEDTETEPPKVELTEEEKSTFFLKKSSPDVAPHVMLACYAKFSTPDDDEGFDDIQYEWQKGDKANEYLTNWVQQKKLTTRIENIKPGEEFIAKKAEFAKVYKEWQEKLKAYQAAGAKKPAKKAEDGAEDDDVDIFSVEDVNDVGEGVPLYDGFLYEDWELAKLRFELCTLVLSFKKDANDPDRTGIPLDHLGWYYQRYFNENLIVKRFGTADINELAVLVKDVVQIKDSLLVSSMEESALETLDIFLKLAEEGRRERQRRIDAGDETARLKIEPPPAKVAPPAKQEAGHKSESQGKEGKSWEAGKGKGKEGGGKDSWGGGKDKEKGKDKGKGWGKGKKW